MIDLQEGKATPRNIKMGDTLPCIHLKEKDLEMSGKWGYAKVFLSVEIVHAVFILKVVKGTAINSPQLELTNFASPAIAWLQGESAQQ